MCRHELVEWLSSNAAWVFMVSKTILGHKCIELHDYLSDLISPGFVYDKIALLVIAYMYNFHIAVILNGTFWSTMVQADINTAHVFLAYFRKKKFMDTSFMYLPEPNPSLDPPKSPVAASSPPPAVQNSPAPSTMPKSPVAPRSPAPTTMPKSPVALSSPTPVALSSPTPVVPKSPVAPNSQWH